MKVRRKTALVIVHLSSLDTFTWIAGARAGTALGCRIANAIDAHEGPVVIVDQGWPLDARASEPRADVLEAVRSRRGKTVWISFDEDVEEWDPFLVSLRRQLASLGVTHTVVGGVWYDPKLKTGCATAVYLDLRSHFTAVVDPALVGCA